MFELLFGAGTFGGLLLLGWLVGGTIERSHLQDLQRREDQHREFLVTQLRNFPCARPGQATRSLTPTLLCAEVVISSDYLKTYLGSWKNFFGGEIRSFQSLLERARREALLRLVEDASQRGYNALCNVRLETVDLAGRESQQRKAIVVASILASATAYQAERS